MVAEAIPAAEVEETPVPQPEAEAAPSPPTPDPSVETPAEETPAEEPSELDEATTAFVRGLKGEEEGSAPQGTAPEDDTTLTPKEQAHLNRVLTEQQKAAQYIGVTESYRNTHARLDQLATVGVPPNVIAWIKNEFNTHHANTKTVFETEAGDAAAVRAVNEHYTAAGKVLGLNGKALAEFVAARGETHKGPDDMIGDVVTRARKGYTKDSEVKNQIAEALLKYKTEVVEPLFGKAPPRDGGGGGRSSAASDAAKLANPDTPVEELVAIRERQRRSGG